MLVLSHCRAHAPRVQVCRNEKLRMDLCYTDPGDSALRKGGMVVQTELGESKTSISPIGGPKGVASFSTIQVPGLEHIYEARTQCKVRLDWRTPRPLPSSPERLVRPSHSSYAPQERLKRRCDDVRSEVADDLVEGATQSRRV